MTDAPSDAAIAQLKTAFDAVNDLVLYHPKLEAALEYARGIQYLGPFKQEAPCFEITGASGVGKTTLWEKLQREQQVKELRRVELPRRPVMYAPHRPYLTLTLEESPTVEEVCNDVLKALGDQEWYQGSVKDKNDRIDRFLHFCGTNVIYVDEAQYLIDRSGIVIANRIIDWLRDRHAAASRATLKLPGQANSVSICVIGMGRIGRIFSADLQRARRFDAGHRLDGYDRKDDDEVELFANIVLDFLEACPFKIADEIDPTDPAVFDRFHYATWGMVGPLKKILRRAVMIVASPTKPRPELTMSVLAEAFDAEVRVEMYPVAVKVARDGVNTLFENMQNPFKPSFDPSKPRPELPDDTVPIPTAAQRRRMKERSESAAQVFANRRPK